MNWLRSSPIDEQVDKATSENLPTGTEDLALNLEICDQIRSKQVSPKDAAKALKRRISHKNPNVQLLALGLTDACVKNGGQHFLVEIASRDFIDNLMSVLKTPAGCNPEVKNKILMLIQTWGRLFRGKQDLGYVCDTYMILQHEGYQFPPADNVGAALVETAAPPDWTDSDVCTRCRTAFTITNRKHHCRACGSTFCGQCSSKTTPLPHLGINQDVRVCDGCWMKKKMGGKGTAVQDGNGSDDFVSIANTSKQPVTSSFSNASSSAAITRHEDDDDEELRKAIELSLKEADSRPGYVAPSSARKEPESIKKLTASSSEEENDAELLAAIEASLRESTLNTSSSPHVPQSDQRPSAYATYTYSTKPESATDPATSITETEKENIEMFSALVDKIQMTNGDVTGNREVQALYEQISKLQAKVALSIEEADKKQKEVIQFNDQIDQAVKMYDHLLQERLNATYQNRMNVNNYGQPGLQQQIDRPLAGYSSSSPQTGHVYTGPDNRYNQYSPGAPYNQQPNLLLALQSPYQYQPTQPPTTAPFNVSSLSTGPSGPEFASAPFASAPPPGQPGVSQAPYQPSQDPYYASAPVSYALSPPGGQSGGQFHQHGYTSMTVPLQAAPVDQIGQAPYAPYSGQQDQQQQRYPGVPLQAYTPVAPAAPVVPVEEKPLIEL
ncbi:Vacuolar protein-sorting-associated protein 27 [Mortierella sp. AD010]|nr:Vacuolar protein-sorting-associated protein 27 [Mortierella sp. AD010]